MSYPTAPLRAVLDCTSVPRQVAGAGRYALELARALATLAQDPQNGLDLLVLERWGMLDDVAGQGVSVLQVGAAGRGRRLVWEQTLLPKLLWSERPAIYHSTHHSLPVLPCPAKKVVTVHDVTFDLIPERYQRSRRLYMRASTRAAALLADGIIVPSQAVRGDFERVYRPRRASVTVIPEGVADAFRAPAAPEAVAELRRRYGLPGSYVLQLARNDPGKNRNLVVEAFARLAGRFPDLSLVLAGPSGWKVQPLPLEPSLASRVRDLGYVPQEDLPLLYAGAALFAFPSVYEGFGLPILEAMAASAPVVTSAGGACPEVLGGAGLVVEPLSAEGLADAMCRVLADPSFAAELQARGRRRASGFTWEAAARQTLSFYREVAGRWPGAAS